jgi:3-oxoacyl-[acyl-carrier-protein] synthase II
MAESPISPFSHGIGVTFGEGAGFVVLELLEEARQRECEIYGELYGHGDTGDAHHITAPAPSGEGLARAMRRAMRRAGLSPDQVDYVNAHGTGTRDNDTAESIAIATALGEAAKLPPVSSTKSYFGHTLGAAGILEFIATLLAQREGMMLPTLNHRGNRPGCSLDYIPNQARPATIRAFLSNSAAFGGINATVAAGEVRAVLPERSLPLDDIWITGRGVVSPIGCGIPMFRQGLIDAASGIRKIDRFDTSDMACSHAGLVDAFKPRKLVPTIDVRRAEELNRYAMVAAGLAMQEAAIDTRVVRSERLGMVMGLMYGSISVQENFNHSLVHDGLENLSAKYFPSMVVSTIGGQVSQSFSLRGINTSIVDGFTGGLNALIQGYEILRQDDELDAVVVVVADEIGRAMFDVFNDQGVLSPDAAGEKGSLRAYGNDGPGMFLGEGGAAILLERASHARQRGARPLAQIAGYGMSNDAVAPAGIDAAGEWYTRAIERALAASQLDPRDVQLVYGHGRGDAVHDARELAALNRVFHRSSTRLGCLTGNLGLCGASSGIFSAIAATLSLEHGECYPVVDAGSDGTEQILLQSQYESQLDLHNILLAGSTEAGNNAAILLRTVPQPS